MKKSTFVVAKQLSLFFIYHYLFISIEHPKTKSILKFKTKKAKLNINTEIDSTTH